MAALSESALSLPLRESCYEEDKSGYYGEPGLARSSGRASPHYFAEALRLQSPYAHKEANPPDCRVDKNVRLDQPGPRVRAAQHHRRP
jgi:hypothetical protein